MGVHRISQSIANLPDDMPAGSIAQLVNSLNGLTKVVHDLAAGRNSHDLDQAKNRDYVNPELLDKFLATVQQRNPAMMCRAGLQAQADVAAQAQATPDPAPESLTISECNASNTAHKPDVVAAQAQASTEEQT